MATVKRIVSSASKRKGSKKVTDHEEAQRSLKTEKSKARRKMLASLTLPTEPKEPVLDFSRYSILLYGRQKIGKTIFLSSFPRKTCFLTTEPGTKGLKIIEFNAKYGGVTDWEVLLRFIDMIEAQPDLYRTVVVDTGDEAYQMCLDYVCEKLHIDYPGTMADGTQDRGASWRKVRKEFKGAISRIVRTGCGVHFTSHAKEILVKERSGGEFNRVVPTMTGQARDCIESLVDHIFFADYMRAGKHNARVIITEGDEFITAGARETGMHPFPPMLPMLKRGGYEMLLAALDGKDVGLNPQTLMPSNAGFKVLRKFLTDQKVQGFKSHAIKKGRG